MTLAVGVTIPNQWGQSDVRMRIKDIGTGIVFDAPIAPRKITYGGFEWNTTESERVGKKPLLRARSRKPRTMSMEVPIFQVVDGTKLDIRDYLVALQRIAESKSRVTVLYDADTAACEWVITALSYESSDRDADDAVTVAMATIDFTESPRIGGASNAPENVAGGPGGGSPGWKVHRVKKGDTPRSISRKYYGTEKHWRDILDANGIANANGLKVGAIISIPKPTWK